MVNVLAFISGNFAIMSGAEGSWTCIIEPDEVKFGVRRIKKKFSLLG